jgi:hypothetical protein
MTPDEYSEVDRLIFKSDLLTKYNADLRNKVFRLVESFGVNPYSIPSWSGCIGSPCELVGFIKEATKGETE